MDRGIPSDSIYGVVSLNQMKRPIFNFFAAISLAICIAVALAWVRSSVRFDRVRLTSVKQVAGYTKFEYWSGALYPGVIVFHRDHGVRWPAKGGMISTVPLGIEIKYDHLNRPGVRFHHKTGLLYFGFDVRSYSVSTGEQSTVTDVCVPFWLFAMLSAALPAIWYRRFRRDRRRRFRLSHGLCVFCGYDIRSTGSRCPECGTVPVQSDRPPLDEQTKGDAARTTIPEPT
jgi:hypothetical protein